MKKGIVMDIGDGFLTLLTPEGEFIRARKQNIPYQIGEEIHFFPFESQINSRNFSLKSLLKHKPIWMVSVIAAFVIFFGSFMPIYHDNKAYAYMSIDVNPSIELGLNKKMQVVELTGFNKDGKKVISSLHNWKNEDVSQLTQTIFNEMKKEGYLRNNNKPVIISTVLTEDPSKEAKEQLNENINEIKATVKDEHLDVTIYNSTEKEREEAKKLGITTGKYHQNLLNSSPSQKSNVNEGVDKKGNETHKNVTQPPVTIPSGQIKNPIDNGAINSNNPNQPDKNDQNQNSDTKIPPGQLKKNDQEPIKNNYGHLKKNNEEPVKNNYGQQKKFDEQHKQNSWQLRKQYDQKEKSNDKHESNHKEKH